MVSRSPSILLPSGERVPCISPSLPPPCVEIRSEHTIVESEAWSSEDDDDRHPSSIKSLMKKIVREARLAGHVTEALANLRIQPTVQDVTRDVAYLTLGERSDAKPSGYACRHCSHSFAMRKTRDIHQNRCSEK